MKKHTDSLQFVPATVLADFYKITHDELYPDNTTKIYSTFTPRSFDYFPTKTDYAVAFGYQMFIKKTLINYFNEHFFNRPLEEVVSEFEYVIENTLGGVANSDKIKALHKLGYLPLEIKALPEGTKVPVKVPVLTIENTLPEFFWVTNYIESIMSSELWLPSTSATTASHFRRIFDAWAIETTGSTAGVDFQGHDFSLRGMQGLESAVSSGMGHLLSFIGTDNIPSAVGVEMYYNQKLSDELIATSVKATEHSIMSSYGRDEYTAYKTLMEKVPTGILSVVSDTYDYFGVLTDILPKLKEEILSRDGKLVIRPDTGKPIDILCGTKSYDVNNTPEEKGTFWLLWETFGGTINDQGYKVLDSHVGVLQGDAVTLKNVGSILRKLEENGFASTNLVVGIGAFSMAYMTRDSLGMALKATYAIIDGEEKFIEKDPKTDLNNLKKSLTGKVAVVNENGKLKSIDHLTSEDEKNIEGNLLQTIFKDGKTYNEQTFTEIKNRLHKGE